jgi:hypothetical protein
MVLSFLLCWLIFWLIGRMKFRWLPPLWVGGGLTVIALASAFGAMIEKRRILSEVNPNWRQDLPKLRRVWSMPQLFEQHRYMYPGSNRIMRFWLFVAGYVVAIVAALLLSYHGRG